MKRFLNGVAVLMCALTLTAEEASNDPLNAVVKLEITKTIPNYWLPWQNELPVSGAGTGTVIPGGLILTNAHNVADASLITVRKQNDDTLFVAKVKFVDHECDLALLTVDDPGFLADITPLELAETPPPQSMVVAAGFPIGGDGLSLTQGIVSRVEIQSYAHSDKKLLAAQVDASLNPGNSGGPLLFDGKVVGIAFQGRGDRGYMIPYEIIRHFLDDIRDGRVDGFGTLGIRVGNLDNPDTRAYLKMKPGQTGVMICKVSPGTDGSAVKVGDVILSIDGKAIANNANIRLADGQPRHFSTVVSAKQVGEKVKLTLLREGEEVASELTVRKFHEQVEPYLYDRHPEYFIIGGLVFTPLTHSYLESISDTALMRKIGEEKASPEENVVLLAEVLSDEANVGYQELDSVELISINGQKVHSLKEVVDMVDNCTEKYITFLFDDDIPVILDLDHLREATPRVLERYRVPSDRYLE